MILILLLFINTVNASDVLSFREIAKLQAKKINLYSKPVKKKKSLKSELKEMKKKLESYRYMARMQLKTPLILSENIISEATMIGAVTTQAIMASNTPKTTILSNIQGVDLPLDTKILCLVHAKYKRICGTCNRIIISGIGYDINAELQNKDGSSCVIGKLSDDKEKYLTGILISEMAQGALALSQSSIPTISGNLIESTAKNKIAAGLINTGSEATDLLKEEYQTSEPIVTLAPNTQVIVQFIKGFSL
jgi:hypothetical protein